MSLRFTEPLKLMKAVMRFLRPLKITQAWMMAILVMDNIYRYRYRYRASRIAYRDGVTHVAVGDKSNRKYLASAKVCFIA